jgi:2-C-methyl-D-erythritol 4-phosphate cytidylyltransferase
MGADKLLAPLQGIPVLQRTIDVFSSCPEITEIILIAPPERAAALTLPVDCKVVDGGAERHHSVWAGLRLATQPLVAVHDGARPLVSRDAISQTIAAAAVHGAAALAKPVTETLKRANAQQQVEPTSAPIDRSQLWSMETPQVFRRELLVAAYELVLAGNHLVTDEVSALQLLGHPVQLVESTAPNLKVTYPADLALAERLLPPANSPA